jgi:hypothetical protein
MTYLEDKGYGGKAILKRILWLGDRPEMVEVKLCEKA